MSGVLKGVLLIVLGLLFGGWAAAPDLAATWPRIQAIVWISEWMWFLAMLPVAIGVVIIGIRTQTRGRGFVLIVAGVVPLAIVGAGSLQREWRPWSRATPGIARIVFLCAQDPPKPHAGQVLDSIEACNPDLVIVVNPGWLAPTWRSRIAESTSMRSNGTDAWQIRWVNPIMVASRHGNVSVRTITRHQGITIMRVGITGEAASDLGLSDIVVVDLPSDPSRSRVDVLKQLKDLLETQRNQGNQRCDMLVGDFNTTPRTLGIEEAWPGHVDLFAVEGAGWGGTWPRETPMFRIDIALGPKELDARSVWTFDPGWGGHRGLVVEVGTGD